MRVIKRNGTYQNVQFDKITTRINHLAYNLQVEPVLVAQKVCGQLIDGIQTSMLDEISAQICMAMYNIHPDYNVLGSRILVDNHIKNTPTSMLEVVHLLPHILDPDFINLIEKHHSVYDEMIDFDRDFLIDYFGLKTLMKSYLLRKDKIIIERPQHLWMRVAIFLHKDDFNAVKETYDWLSTKHFTHASPTLFNSGTKHPQLSSCFVAGTLVNTVNRGPVPIENVVIGDSVVTHNGNIKNVEQIHQNKLGHRKLYNVFMYNTQPFVATEDHKLWTYNTETMAIKWTRIDELTVNDYTSLPNINGEGTKFTIKPYIDKYIYTDKRIMGYDSWKLYENFNNSIFTTEFDLTDDIMWLFGILTRSGIVIYNTNTANDKYILGVFITVTNPEQIQRICDILACNFDITQNMIEKDNSSIRITNLFLGILVETLLSTIPTTFYTLSRKLIHNWLLGFTHSSEYINQHLVIDVSAHAMKLLNDVYTLCRLNNYAISEVRINGNVKNIEIDGFYHNLNDDKSHVNMYIRNIDNTTFVKYFHKIEDKSKHSDYVYTLGVQDDHSYSIGGIIAENCFLTTVEDSVEGIFKTLTDCALISKWAGGIGINISDVRGNNSIIRGTNGVTQGILPLLKTYNATGRYINQCFVGSTIIYTKNGPKSIKNIIPNVDYVLTSNGTFKKVLGRIENEVEKKILKIKNAYTLESIKCTDEHQIYISRDEGNTCKFVSASELCINDYMVFPIPTEYQDNDVLTNDLCRLYGILLACGYYVKDGWYNISIHSKFKSTIEFLQKYLDIHIDSDSTQFKFKHNFPIKHEWIYPLQKTKAIHPMFLNLPVSKLIHVLYGIFETKINLNNCQQYIYFVNSNRMFIESIRYAFLRLKTLTFGNKLFKSNAYYLKIPINENIIELTKLFGIQHDDDHTIQWIEKDNFLMSKIKSINSVQFKGTVYDLQIDENHNYTTHMGLVHNSGKRLGSFAMYIEPWHVDIFDFLNAKKNQGAEEERARDLFYALWIPDLFMERVKNNDVWSLMCPDTCVNLTSTYGDEFNKLYLEYENSGKFIKQIKARQVWDAIIESQIETGVPYMLYKDAVNRKSPQENIGIIKQSNLCTEIVLYTDKNHISVCNLASIALPSFINLETMEFDYDKLENVVRVVTRNLNKVIDLTYYPVKEAKNTNLKHRPIGIGIQGLADVFAILKWPFDSEKSRQLNKCIFECIYYASMSESCKLSKEFGPYDCFDGSPMSHGIFQFDMWNKNHVHPSNRYNWDELKQDVMKYGLRNSTLIAPMPTASTSQILGFNECIVKGTLVTDIHGLAKPIEKIEPDESLLTFNDNFNKLINSKVVEHLDKGVKDVVKLQLIDGRSIECTPEHKFKVCNTKTKEFEWIEASAITRDYSFVMGLRGIVDKYVDEKFDVEMFNCYFEKPTIEKCLALARLLGFVLADGHYIDMYKSIIHVDTLYDSQLILHDLELLDDTKTFAIVDNNINMTINIGKPITNIMCKVMENCREPDFDIQHAMSTESNADIYVPQLLFDDMCPRVFIREFLAGYCGGDGISPYLKWTNNNCKMVGCDVVRAVSHLHHQKIERFMHDIKYLFEKIDITTSIHTKEYVHNNSHIHVYNMKILNKSDFTNYVGFRYNIHKMLRCEIFQTKFNYINAILQQRRDIIEKIFELYNTQQDITIIYNNVIHQYENIFLHELSIPTLEYAIQCIEKKSIIDIPIDINDEQFLNDMSVYDWFSKNDNIIEKTKLCLPIYCIPFLDRVGAGTKQVYDINILDTHSFVANGMVVHNCIEPFTSNLYLRRTLAGEFTCINKYLVRDLHDLNLWTKDIMEKLIYYKGSVQYIKEIPQHIKDVYKTVWEIKQRSLLEMAADRGVYVCQSQSLNLFFDNPNYSKLTSAHFLGWQLGLKTGSYYVRSQSAIDAQNFTIDPLKEKELEQEKKQIEQEVVCPMRPKGMSNYEPCEACSG
jgi:ribonucleoside-diphosphate reductase alpha subunit